MTVDDFELDVDKLREEMRAEIEREAAEWRREILKQFEYPKYPQKCAN